MFTNLIIKIRKIIGKIDKKLEKSIEKFKKLEVLISDYILYKSIAIFKYLFFKFL